MGEHTAIAWCDATFNPWRGCSRVSPGCDHCYAEAWSKRNPAALGTWGDDGERVIAADAYWRTPLRWNRLAAEAGVRRRVFCASLADVFEDRPELVAPRDRLFELIRQTPHLDWLLLTKRPDNARRILAMDGPLAHGVHELDILEAIEDPHAEHGPPLYHRDDHGYITFRWPLPNVWLGVTAEDQQRADERIPILIDTPAAVRFVSYEPALGPIDLLHWLGTPRMMADDGVSGIGGIDWVIVGGESGPHARLFEMRWARDTIAQCRAAGVACFVKQLGRRPVSDNFLMPDKTGRIVPGPFPTRHPAGADPTEWPPDLQIQEHPA